MKKIIILFYMIILISVLVGAIDYTEPYIYYKMDEGSGTNVVDSAGNSNGTLNDAGDFAFNSEDWKSARTGNYNIESDDPLANDAKLDTGWNPPATNWGICYWLKIKTDGNYWGIMGDGDGASAYDLYCFLDPNNDDITCRNDGGTHEWDAYTTVNFGSEIHFCLARNDSNWYSWINGSQTHSGSYATSKAAGNLLLFQASASGDNLNADGINIDEVAIYNYTITDADVEASYNSGSGWFWDNKSAPTPPAGSSLGNNTHINSSRLYSNTNRTDSDLILYCNATHDYNSNLSIIYYEIDRDGVLNISGYNIGECVMETANETTGNCTYTEAGKIYPSILWEYYEDGLGYLFDNNWDTEDHPTGSGVTTYININYTKPENIIGAKWLFKTGETTSIKTASIPLSCLNAHDNELELYIQSTQNGALSYSVFFCYNSSNEWKTLYTTATGNDHSNIYEEEMYFNFSFKSGEEYEITRILSDNLAPANNWTARCLAYNGTENSTWLDTNLLNITGFITPDITLNSNNFFKSDNSSIISNETSSSALLNFTFEDDYNLYAYEIKMFNSSNTIIYYSNTTLSGNNFTIGDRINFSTISEGKYYLSVNVSDSHTDKEIKDYKIKKEKNKLIFDDCIEIYAIDAINSDTKKLKDRYNFQFDYLDVKNTRKYIVKSCNDLVYVKSKFAGHLIDWKSKKWIDFEGQGEVTIKKIKNNEIEITVKTKNDKVIFNSIGGLNINHEIYSFYYLKHPSYNWVNKTKIIYNSNYSISVEVTGSYQNLTRLYIYNYTNELVSSVNYTYNGNGTYMYNHSFSNLNLENYTINGSHTDQAGNTIYFSNWDIYTYIEKLSGFQLRNENTNLSITDENITIEIFADKYNYSENLTTSSGYASLNLPTPASFTLKYGGGKYDNRFYFFDLAFNESINTTLYLNDNNTLTQITVTILDENSDFVENAEVQVYKYYLNSNSYLLVEEGITNFEGETRVRLELGEEFYKFRVWYDEEMKKETSPSFIYETELTIYINLEEGVGDLWETTENIVHNIEFQETNNWFKGSYIDDSGEVSKGCLNVYRINNGKTLTNQSCSNTGSAILYVGTVNQSGYTYLAQLVVTIDGEEIVIDEESYTYKQYGKTIFGGDGLFFLILLTITFVGFGVFFNPAVAIVLSTIPLLIFSIIGFITFKVSLALGLFVVSIIIASLVWRKDG